MESRFLWKRLSWPLQIVVWIFAIFISVNIIDNGYDKLIQEQGLVDYFASLGFSIPIMMTVGTVEVVGPFLMLIPRISFYGAVPVFIVMCTATYYNAGSDSVTYISAFLALIVAVLTRPGLLRKKPEITKVSI